MMKSMREEWYDPESKVSVLIADVALPAQQLSQGHLCGPVAAHYLSEALAQVALLGAETSLADEVVSLQMKCSGPLGGLNVECSSAGSLRGYTEKKIFDEYDGMGAPKDEEIVGNRRIQVCRSVPGKIISQGIAGSLEEYLGSSLQRRARIFTAVSVNDEVQVLCAKSVMVEALADSDFDVSKLERFALNVSSRRILAGLGLEKAELKGKKLLNFACRCSPERAEAMLAAMSAEELAQMPEKIDITCHMCGKIYTVGK